MSHAIMMAWLSAAKWIGTSAGVSGAVMVALNLGLAVYGFALFLVSSLLWSMIGLVQREASLLVLQGTCTVINIVGIYRWLGSSFCVVLRSVCCWFFGRHRPQSRRIPSSVSHRSLMATALRSTACAFACSASMPRKAASAACDRMVNAGAADSNQALRWLIVLGEQPSAANAAM